MIQIDNILMSDDIIEKKFVCDLTKCKGECCVAGDAGAPLTLEEKDFLEDIYPVVKEYMRPEGIKAVEENGTSYIDDEHEHVTMLVNNAECAFVVFDEEKIAWCAIEKAYNDGKISFRKPSSCYLYPIRTKNIANLIAVNYDFWDICKSARILGSKTETPVYKFLEQPLTDKFGKGWYQKLTYLAKKRPEKS